MDTPQLLGAAELGAALGGLSARRVLELRGVYKWPHVKIGRYYRWTPEQVAQIVRQHTVIPSKGAKEPTVVPVSGLTSRSASRGKAS